MGLRGADYLWVSLLKLLCLSTNWAPTVTSNIIADISTRSGHRASCGKARRELAIETAFI